MLNDYHGCEKICIGSSDIALLIAVGCGNDDLKVSAISFEEDGFYTAYLCGNVTEIPSHYRKVFECTAWLKIYDDYGLAFDSNSFGDFNHFEIFRSGADGTIIKMWKD